MTTTVALALALASASSPHAADASGAGDAPPTSPPPASAGALQLHPPPAPKAPKPEGHGLVVAGVVLVSTSLAAYVAMTVGLVIGDSAEARIASLHREDDIERRRDLMAKGKAANQLAIGAGVSAAVLMGTGIALLVVGRRRAQRDRARVGPGSLRVRF